MMQKLIFFKSNPRSTISATALCSALALLAGGVTVVAQDYETTVDVGDYTGTRSLAASELVSSAPTPPEWEDVGGEPFIDWTLTDNGSSFTYRYTFTGIVVPQISHISIDATGDFIDSDGGYTGNPTFVTDFAMGDPDAVSFDGLTNLLWNAGTKHFEVDGDGNPIVWGMEGPPTSGDGSPVWEFSSADAIDGIPGAMKMQMNDWSDVVGGEEDTHNFYLEFTSLHGPVWGHMFVKAGGDALGTLSWDGVVTEGGMSPMEPGWDETLLKEGYVPVPNGIIPEPSVLALLGLTGWGLFFGRRRRCS